MGTAHFLSVLITTFNRAEILRTTLDSFCGLDTKDIKWELIVVDNNSTDNTKSVIMESCSKLPIRYVFEKRQGQNIGFNSGLDAGLGDIFAFTADDVSPDENWLKQIARSVDSWLEGQVFGGKVVPLFPDGTPEWMKRANFSSFVFAIHCPQEVEGPYIGSGSPAGGNCWIRRKVFESGIRFDPNLGPKGYGRISGSELELFNRLKLKDIHPIYIPSAIAVHRIQKHQTELRYLIKRSFASGRGYVYIYGPNNSPKLFRVPRFFFRHLIEFALMALMEFAILRPRRGFEYIMDIAHRLGCIKESLKPSKS
jgi:hypothetical protein